ncbi:isopentenyl-diphosphate Delta-isomerase [Chitinophaga sp. SYP-B3965]|uniref:isopentenyl-diphosphate Delta-isomerase n=1 Tax=Chitinophaga sp. SYP-B3965 TaxID=2663120 RepID=UPI001299A8BB|nr:isopentenyl-diphosphate Delta-isomerase [Chitinophaga sp. SYP-B3965]MRG46934.1 isopentenyl-diphosphate Delta-isomerase [Chitinophaga sp. SYP-B3965]
MLPPVILVNEQDEPVGTMEKLEAHQKGLLHRAFSVFVVNPQGEMLLQQRALDKYHSGGLWTNTCCSHPLPGEDVLSAAHRRLMEEMGFDCPLKEVFSFTYRAEFDNGLTEHEFDHVFFGEYDGPVVPDADEVEAVRYLSLDVIRRLLVEEPDSFTHWFHLAFPKMVEFIKER